MKLGLDSYSYHLAFGVHPDFQPSAPMQIFQFIDRVKSLGLDGFQIDPMHLACRDASYLQEVTAHARAHNLFLEYGAMGIDPTYLRQELATCKLLDSPVLRTFVGFTRYSKKTNLTREVTQAIQNLSAVMPDAADFDIKIALENHGDFTADEMLAVMQSVAHPYLGVCLDLGNFLFTLENPLMAVTKLAPYTVTTHFKDYALQMTNYGFKAFGVALGEGCIDLPIALRLLIEKNKLDRIVLEIPVAAEGDEKATLQKEDHIIQRSVQYAREVLKIRWAAPAVANFPPASTPAHAIFFRPPPDRSAKISFR
ncbi:sugar phosphate isomerase/epimerase [candidate division KSB1 bacterium]|nr:sugar phosphate isomerase/epimerase [candidate division KSB1 bacterium]